MVEQSETFAAEHPNRYGPASLGRCYEQLGEDNLNKVETQCYGFMAGFGIFGLALVIISVANFFEYMACGCCNSKPSYTLLPGHPSYDEGDFNKSQCGFRPCACLIATVTGVFGLLLVPFGVVLYLIVAPFSVCVPKEDKETSGCIKARLVAEFLVKGPYSLSHAVAGNCPF